MESETLGRKIEETIIEILKNANLETITEYTVRSMAADRLGIDFSDLDRKWLVRRTIESFLLSSSPAPEEETKEVVQEQQQPLHMTSPNDDGGRVICKLSEKRSVSILKFREKNLVSVRDCYQKDGKQFQSGRGITLTARQWSAFRNSVPAIEEAITKMESRIRSEGVGKHIEAAMPSSTASALQEQNPIPQKQIESETSNPPSTSVPRTNGQPNSPTPFSPQSLVPIEPTRLNGKNYYFWAQQIELFLNQLKIAYVLTKPCPHIPLEARKWTDDDYICRRNILNSLSDHLFDQYSKQSYTAKELWEELKFAFNEDFGAKRSDVHQYIHFEMVDGISVLDIMLSSSSTSSPLPPTSSITSTIYWILHYLHSCPL